MHPDNLASHRSNHCVLCYTKLVHTALYTSCGGYGPLCRGCFGKESGAVQGQTKPPAETPEISLKARIQELEDQLDCRQNAAVWLVNFRYLVERRLSDAAAKDCRTSPARCLQSGQMQAYSDVLEMLSQAP